MISHEKTISKHNLQRGFIDIDVKLSSIFTRLPITIILEDFKITRNESARYTFPEIEGQQPSHLYGLSLS